jgi:hypothetical protein
MFLSPYSRAILVKAQHELYEPLYVLFAIVLCCVLASDILDHCATVLLESMKVETLSVGLRTMFPQCLVWLGSVVLHKIE